LLVFFFFFVCFWLSNLLLMEDCTCYVFLIGLTFLCFCPFSVLSLLSIFLRQLRCVFSCSLLLFVLLAAVCIWFLILLVAFFCLPLRGVFHGKYPWVLLLFFLVYLLCVILENLWLYSVGVWVQCYYFFYSPSVCS
jgi:hypothetical protein